MESVHLIGGIAVLAANALAGAWGAASWFARRPSVGFWYALRVAQGAVVVQVLLGAILLLSEHDADGLHYLYGVLPLVVTLMAEGLRAGAAERELEGLDFESLPADRRRRIAHAIARRETGIMAVSALIVLFLALRAVATNGL